MIPTRQRLDMLLLAQHPEYSRSYIQQCIKAGKVLLNNTPCTKTGTIVEPTDTVTVLDIVQKFVSRGGFKLEAALDYFALDIANLIALDSGISTGGFTDCLLQRGAAKVYGIDVGTAQLHESLRNDPRIILHENTDIRTITSLPDLIDLATLDLSFISLTKIIPPLAKLIKDGGLVIALIKPQFESERHEVKRRGLITDPNLQKKAQEKVTNAFVFSGFKCIEIIPSPLQGAASGNQEFLGLYKKMTQ